MMAIHERSECHELRQLNEFTMYGRKADIFQTLGDKGVLAACHMLCQKKRARGLLESFQLKQSKMMPRITEI